MPETLDEIKKYVGPFSGPQMDQIFYEILNYTSERFAKGTAGGVPVAAGTPGYNDNSLFYKNQAAAQVSLAQAAAAAAANSAQRAESAVPAGTDAAVLWTRDQSTELTADDKAVARKNIMAGGTNPNLLDNPWWGSAEAINQRGVTSGATVANGYNCIDRWKTNYGSAAGTFTLTTGGIELTSGANTYAALQQKIDNPSKLYGKTLTASALLSDGTIIAGTQTFTGSQTITFITQNDVRLMLSNTGEFVLNVYGGPKTIRAVKLELGSVSTLANDTAPNHAEELAKCQRYFIRINATAANAPIGTAIGLSSAAGRLFIPTPVSMRKITPIISANTIGNFHLIGDGDITLVAISSLGTESIHDNGVGLGFTAGANTITTRKIYALTSQVATGYIDISADL